MNNRIIIGITGTWENKSAIVAAIARGYKFLFAGMVLLEIRTQKSCTLEIYEYDSNLTKSFEIASQGRISGEILDRISTHRYTLYAIAESPSLETAKWMLKVGESLLKAGGLAVKVESAGLAHSSEDWCAIASDSDPFAIYRAFVTLVGGQDYYYSCGMHNFGLPDASISRNIEPQTASEILNIFNYYQLIDKPQLAKGDTFSTTPEAPIFKLLHCPFEGIEGIDPSYNPFGRWHLECLAGRVFRS